MGLMDLVDWLVRAVLPADPEREEITEEIRALAADAEGESMTPELLGTSGDRTQHPLVAYLEDGEQPQFVLRGSELLLNDGTDSVTRNHPSLLAVTMITDERIVFVLGGRLSDSLFEVPLADVELLYLDEEVARRYLIVEADKDDDQMAFFADVSLESDRDVLEAAVEYANARREQLRSESSAETE